MMRLHDLAAKHTGALNQYARCATAPREELGVEPGARTVSLMESIRMGVRREASAPGDPTDAPAPGAEELGRVLQVRTERRSTGRTL
jgi:DNA-binding SARP family transcriptional activator